VTTFRTYLQVTRFSPNLSPISFQPVARSFFSDNHTNVTLTDGAIATVDTQVDGEVAGLLKLPATFIDAYMSAIGGIFKGIGDNTANQTTAVNNQIGLRLASAKSVSCNAALTINQPILTTNLRGLSGDALSQAATNISNAWGNVKTACGS
jgi:hypothetical protein